MTARSCFSSCLFLFIPWVGSYSARGGRTGMTALAWLQGLGWSVKHKFEGAPAELWVKNTERIIGRAV